MATRKIDLSSLKRDDIEIVSLTGTVYTIPGNFSTELFMRLYDTYDQVKKLKEEDYREAFEVMKRWALDIVSLDKTKKVTMKTIETEFNDLRVLELLLTSMMQYANADSNEE